MNWVPELQGIICYELSTLEGMILLADKHSLDGILLLGGHLELGVIAVRAVRFFAKTANQTAHAVWLKTQTATAPR